MAQNQIVDTLTQEDLFGKGQDNKLFMGRPYHINYNKAHLLICDEWKHRVKGIPQGAFLLAFYDNPRHEEQVDEALLLRVLSPAPLPTDSTVISSMVEYYKDNLKTSGKESELDDFTRYEFSFSGLECRVLGTFYMSDDKIEFGADVENFYSAHNYKVFKATGNVLQFIVNQRDKEVSAGNDNEYAIGHVRYSSTKRFAEEETGKKVQVFINPGDFLGKRTALFGMTRTGKSNTVKKIIQAAVEISAKAKYPALKAMPDTENALEPIDPESGAPKFPVGQLIFDINGEYANPNLQDAGTAIYELYKDKTIRYSTVDKTQEGFKVLKINFYNDIQAGFELVKSALSEDKTSGDYIKSVLAIDLDKPEGYNKPITERDSDEKNAAILYDKKKALYLACLRAADFPLPSQSFKVKFFGDAKTVSTLCPDIKPHEGISLDQAIQWFSDLYIATENSPQTFQAYKAEHGFDYFDEDMKSLLVLLTRKKSSLASATYSGFRKLRPLIGLHTPSSQDSFENDILTAVRLGKIVIIDLSQGDENIQRLYSEKICMAIFKNSMARFIGNKPNNFIQFYFEEAHNLFPKKEDKDLSQIYNRLAKEGAKLGLGMTYATQEVSSISSNILKNTQNWFIAHLNNEDETKEIRKYYDFGDFTDSLTRFSAKNDKGFVRMKTYSNPFVIPVQIDKFIAKR